MDARDDVPRPAAEDDFDEFARRAGQSLRAPAPERGLTDVVAAGRRRQGAQLVGAITMVALLVICIAAIRSRQTDNAIAKPTIASTPEPATTAPPPTSAEPVTTAGATSTVVPLTASPLDGWTISYTGNPAGPVQGSPFGVGVIHDAGGFSEVATMRAAVRYLNEVGGGIAGHPIDFVGCGDIAPASACAEKLAADPSVSVLLWSGLDAGPTAELVKAMGTAKPTLTPFVCYCQEDAVAGHVASLQASHLDAVAGAAHLLNGLDPSARIGVISIYDDSTRKVVESIVGPARTVALEAAPTPTSVRQVLADANATDVRYFVADIGFNPCEPRSDAWHEALPDATFVGVFCDQVPEGWYNVGPGYTADVKSADQGAATIPARLADAGVTRLQNDNVNVMSNMQARWAADLFVLARIVNQLGGVEKATPQAINDAIQSYKGPVPLTGDVDCTAVATNGTCVTSVPVFQLKNGTWIEHPAASARRGP